MRDILCRAGCVEDGLLRLRGFLGETDRGGRAYYYLYHLKLIDYLRGAQAAAGIRIFSARDVEQWHGKLAVWCEAGGLEIIWQDAPGDALEQERRTYARQHYIAHLAAAHAYERLWSVVDDGAYGAAKRRYDPSTRSYALDLDIVRQAIIDAVAGDADAQARGLPRLWRYSLLRCSLASQVDKYPEELFLALVALGRSGEAINIAELLSDPAKKAIALLVIGSTLLAQERDEGGRVLQRVRAIAETIRGEWERANIFSRLAAVLIQAQYWDKAYPIAAAIPVDRMRAEALIRLAVALVQAQDPAAPGIFAEARATVDAISDDWRRSQALSSLAVALVQAQDPAARTIFAEARATADAISDDGNRDLALCSLVNALAQAQRWNEARNVANTIQDTDLWNSAFSSLVDALAQAQRWDEARNAANTIQDDGDRAEALYSLVVALAQTQCWGEAHVTAAAIRDDRMRTDALSSLSAAQAQAQAAFNDARAAAAAIQDARKRVAALSNLATAQIQAQDPAAQATFAEAYATADAIYWDDLGRAQALSSLATALAQIQQWDDARTAADAIPDDVFWVRLDILSRLTTALARAQRWEEARVTAAAIWDDGTRAAALGSLAITLAQAQDSSAPVTFAEACSTAEAIPDNSKRAEALKRIATALARANLLPQATALLTDCWRRAQTRDELLGLFAVDSALIRAYPELGKEFLDSFAWVDAQIKVI